MSDDPTLHRDIGRLEAQVTHLTVQVDTMQKQIGVMHDAIVSAKGGWRVLVGVGAVAATLSAALTKLLGVVWR